MSAVKSQTRSALHDAHQFHHDAAAATQCQPFALQRPAQNTSVGFPSFTQNMRRQITTCTNANSAFTSRLAGAPNGNFVFIQSAQGDQAQAASSMTDGVSASQRREAIKFLKAYLPDLPETRLSAVLERTRWDSEKALELLMEETFNQRNSANQQKLSETQQVYLHACGQTRPESAQSSQQSGVNAYQVQKPSKRRRQQFDSQQNYAMQSAQASPQRNSTRVSSSNQVSAPVAQRAATQSMAQQPPSVQQTENPASGQTDLEATRNYKNNLALNLGQLLSHESDDYKKLSLIQQALDHFADVVSKQQLSQTNAQLSTIKGELSETQTKQKRLEHDNRILRRGFNSMLKRQNEWCKDKEKMDEVLCENQTLRAFFNERLKKQQPTQAFYNAQSMDHSRPDVI